MVLSRRKQTSQAGETAGDKNKLESVQKRSARFITRDLHKGAMTNMLRQLDLPSLEERRRHLRLTTLFKVVRGLVPALPVEKFLKKVEDKRQIKPKNFEGFSAENIVIKQARNNTECYETEQPTSDVRQNSFFVRTVIEWNNLSSQTVQATSVESFKTLLSKRA